MGLNVRVRVGVIAFDFFQGKVGKGGAHYCVVYEQY